jgi:hypothetical protein
MNLERVALLSILIVLGGCASAPVALPVAESELAPQTPSKYPPPQQYPPPAQPVPPPPGSYAAVQRADVSRWRTGAPAMQGLFGVSYIDSIERKGGSSSDVDVDSSQFPVLGGGGQFKLGGERVDLGLEALFDFSGRGNVDAFAVGGGGAAIAVSVDLWIFEIYGGPFANVFLGDKCRAYVGAGPMIEWANYNQYNNGFSGSGSGFGSGWYARTGIEFATSPGTMIGLCARWTDATIDLGGNLGDLDVQGTQIMLSVTRGF